MARPDRSNRAALLLRTAMSGAVAWAVPAAALPGAPSLPPLVSSGGSLPVVSTVGAVQTIKLNAPRTVIQYNGFTIAGGETVNFRFDNRSDLAVVHSTTSAIQVDGTLNSFVGAGSTYGGNVWLLSAAGVFFGAGARVDVGGLLASTSMPDLTAGGPVLDPTTLAFKFNIGNSTGAVTVASGALITGHGGTLAFIAPSVTTGKNAIIGGGGDTSVLYGAAQRYTVQFVQEAGNDLDLLSFEVPGLDAGSTAAMPLQLAGTTAAGNVYIASIGRADAVRAVLDAPGDITASSAELDGGTIVLTAGGGITNHAVAAVLTNGLKRQDINASGAINGTGDVTVTATGDITLPGTVVAGGSIRLRGVNIDAASLTAGEDIVVRGGDEIGSTTSTGYGHYLAEGGQLQIAFASAGDDVLGTTWNGDTEFGTVILAGTGGDLAGDPLGILDAAGDGHRLRLTTTGESGDVYLGRDGEFRGGQSSPSFAFENPIDTLTLGANGVVSLDAVGAVGVTLSGNATIHDAIAHQGLATFGATGAMNVGTVTAVGGIGVEGLSASVGTATTTLDQNSNGLIVVHGLTSASIANANAATDVLVVADNGNAVVGTAHAGDDVIIRAYGGSASLTSASVGVFDGGENDAPDQDTNRFSFGEAGSITLFTGRSLDFDGNGRTIDVAATTGAFAPIFDLLPPAPVPGAGDVFLGLGNGTITGADHVFLDADHDIAVDLIGAPVIDEAFAGHDIVAVADAIAIEVVVAGGSASVTARTGDAHVDQADTALDLSVIAANGLAHMGDAHVGQDFLLSGKTVELGSLSGSMNTGYGCEGEGFCFSQSPTRDITILASAGGFTYDQSLTASRDLTINVSGDLLISLPDDELPAVLTAGDDVRLHGATIVVDTIAATGSGPDTEADGSNIVLGGGAVTVYQADSANDILVDSTGLVYLGAGFSAIAARDIVIKAGGIDYGSLQAGRDLKLTATAGTLTSKGFGTSDLISGRDLLIDVSGDLVAGSLAAVRDLTLSGATVTVQADDENTGTAIAGRDLTVNARNGGLVITNAEAGDDVRLSGATIDVETARSTALNGAANDSEGDGSNIVVSGGTVSVLEAESAHDLLVDATGLAHIGSGFEATAANDIVIHAADIEYGSLVAGRDLKLTATAGTLTVVGFGTGFLTSGRDILIDVSGDLVAGGLTAIRDLTLAGATITVQADAENPGTATAGRDLTATARNGALVITNAQAGDDVRLSGATIDVDAVRSTALNGAANDSEGDGSNIFATGGTITLEQAVAATDIKVVGTGVVTVGSGAAGEPVGTVGDYFAQAGQDILITGASILAGPLSAGRDITATATSGDAHLGSADAKRDLTVVAALGLAAVGDARVGSDLLMTGKNVSLGSLDGYTDSGYGGYGYGGQGGYGGTFTPTRNATLTATAGDVLGGASLFVAGDVLVDATGNVALGDIGAGNDVIATAGAALELGDVSGGQDVKLKGGTLATGGIDAGRDLSLTATASGITVGDLTAVRDLTLDASADLHAGNVGAGRDVTLAGANVTVTSAVATRDLTVTGTLGISGDLFQAGGNLILDPNQPIVAGTVIAGGNATLVGGSIDVGSLTVGGTTFAQATAGGISFDTFDGTGDAVLIATGKVDLGAVTAAGLRIVGGDLDVRNSLVASTLAVETPGNMIIGGTAADGESGFRLAAADMARLHVTGIANFYAGVTTAANEGVVAGGNMTIQDFGYDPADLPRMAFFADRTHVVDITGHVAPSTNGGAIQIGDANVNGRFRPASIYVSGGLGSAELVANCFGKIVGLASLSMFAVNDIIFGASDFRGVIQSTDAGAIDLGAGAPGVPAGPGDDRLFVVSARFNVDAGGKIVSQSTASSAGAFVGLVFTGIGAPGEIVGVGNARAIDLAGSLVDGSGFLRSGAGAAKAGGLGPGGTAGALFRFNGCIVGGADCTGQPGANPAEALRIEAYQPPRPIDITDGPLTTVLVIDQQQGGLDVLTVDNDGKVIVIKKKPGE